MKRLYKDVWVEEGVIELDGHAVKTPGRAELLVPTRALADAIAAEWRTQGDRVLPHTMPLMQLAATAIDHIPAHRAAVEAAITRFIDTDTICYPASEPAALAARQNEKWQPLLDWAAQFYGARFVTAEGLVPVAQPNETVQILTRVVTTMNDWNLCALQAVTAASGSIVIALALMEKRISAVEAFEAAELESSYEIERWGEDTESTARRATVADDLAAARRFRDLLEQP